MILDCETYEEEVEVMLEMMKTKVNPESPRVDLKVDENGFSVTIKYAENLSRQGLVEHEVFKSSDSKTYRYTKYVKQVAVDKDTWEEL